MTYGETEIAAAIERVTGASLDTLPQAQLDELDQYHAGGFQAVERLIPHLALAKGARALDVGVGLGGPARQIARATGCDVVGVDITPAYVDAAQTLTEISGLTNQARFFCSDIAEFEQTGFDAAYTIHVQMNIADKESFYSEIARRLRSGARLVVFEVCQGPNGQPTLPLPWSLDGFDSHLVTSDELCGMIQSSGFTLLDWTDESSWAREWFIESRRRRESGVHSASLAALLAEGPKRLLNFATAVATGSVTINRGVFTAK